MLSEFGAGWGGGSERQGSSGLVDHLVHRGLLVPRARHDVLVVGRDVAAEHGRRLLGLQNKAQTRGELTRGERDPRRQAGFWTGLTLLELCKGGGGGEQLTTGVELD